MARHVGDDMQEYPIELLELNSSRTLELSTPQRKDEISLIVKVEKVDRLENQQPSPEQGKVQRLSVATE